MVEILGSIVINVALGLEIVPFMRIFDVHR